MSEGTFINMTPHRPVKRSPADVDESSDTFDSIDWLVKNVPHNNGRVGMWGISYPGFYAAAGMIDAHPSLKAVSPQAPIADWFAGDDFHHNGAFFLLDAFSFFSGFGKPRPLPTPFSSAGFTFGTNDAYRFFLDLGPLSNADARFLGGAIPFWEELMTHGTYDSFWQERNLLPHIRAVTPAVMIVGGLFDAEDLYGPLSIYSMLKKESPGTRSSLIIGPWQHGGWARTPGSSLGDIEFGGATSVFYRDSVEFPFFNRYLKHEDGAELPAALVFETGSDTWNRYAQWPPSGAAETSFYFRERRGLSAEPPHEENGYDEYVSDPARPVPYTNTVSISRGVTYVVEDQRFASRRPDVLTYETVPLSGPLRAAGPVTAELYVSTTGTDADFVVKVVDVFPDTTGGGQASGEEHKRGYQMLVRAEVMRGKFRNSLSVPDPFVPGKVTPVRFKLRDISHMFLAGHRVMVQVQSSWFPLVDRNPQSFVDIYRAGEADFRKETERIHHAEGAASRIILNVIR
jgi:putative CocE/NonD family hydrolase